MQRVYIWILLSLTPLLATQEFNLQSIKKYITTKNFYVYKALTQNLVSKEELKYVQGQFDAQLKLKYEDKDYTLSESNYYDASLVKPTQSGIDFSMGYRQAEGLQEYSNIKTPKNGEVIIGAKIPLVSVLNGIDERRLKVNLAKNSMDKTQLQYKESLRTFQFKLMTTYYALLYYQDIKRLREEIIKRMKLREKFLKSKVEKGKLPRIDLLEAKRQLLIARQKLIDAKRHAKNKLYEFVQFLNISEEHFLSKHHLPSLPEVTEQSMSFAKAFSKALEGRPDLQMLYVQKDNLFMQQRANEVKKYPKFELNLQGVYDENDQSGLKVSFQMNFPMARSQYHAKSEQLKHKMRIVDNEKELQLLELQTDLKTVFNSLELVGNNIETTQEEVVLLKELEKLEKKRYELGSSTLFLLNQRETQTVQAEVDLLFYKYQYHLLDQTLKRVVNIQDIF